MALEKLEELAFQGAGDNRLENVAIPTVKAIKELRFDYFNTVGELTAGEDPFNWIFQSIELTFDGKSQYIIENIVDLYNIVMAYTGKPPKISIQMDTDTIDLDVIKMKFRLPVLWQSALGVRDPRIKVKYQTAVATDDVDDGTLRIRYVHTDDTANWTRFRYVKDEKEAGTDETKDFKPDVGAKVRGAFIRSIDASVTDLYDGGSRYSLGAMGGSLTLAEITMKHLGVEYFSKATERDILHHMEDVFKLVDFPFLDDATNESGASIVGGLAMSPFNYLANESTATAGALQYSDPQAWLYISFEDIVSDNNTLLRIKTGSSNWTTSDQVSVIWVYTQDPPKEV